MLIDSDILIDFLRGRLEAQKFFNQFKPPFYISYISKFEILAGSVNKTEMKLYEDFLSHFILLPITNEIIELAFQIFKEHFLRSKIGWQDAIIAASAIYYNIPLISRNKKHYAPITRLNFRAPY